MSLQVLVQLLSLPIPTHQLKLLHHWIELLKETLSADPISGRVWVQLRLILLAEPSSAETSSEDHPQKLKLMHLNC